MPTLLLTWSVFLCWAFHVRITRNLYSTTSTGMCLTSSDRSCAWLDLRLSYHTVSVHMHVHVDSSALVYMLTLLHKAGEYGRNPIHPNNVFLPASSSFAYTFLSTALHATQPPVLPYHSIVALPFHICGTSYWTSAFPWSAWFSAASSSSE